MNHYDVVTKKMKASRVELCYREDSHIKYYVTVHYGKHLTNATAFQLYKKKYKDIKVLNAKVLDNYEVLLGVDLDLYLSKATRLTKRRGGEVYGEKTSSE